MELHLSTVPLLDSWLSISFLFLISFNFIKLKGRQSRGVVCLTWLSISCFLSLLFFSFFFSSSITFFGDLPFFFPIWISDLKASTILFLLFLLALNDGGGFILLMTALEWCWYLCLVLIKYDWNFYIEFFFILSKSSRRTGAYIVVAYSSKQVCLLCNHLRSSTDIFPSFNFLLDFKFWNTSFVKFFTFIFLFILDFILT